MTSEEEIFARYRGKGVLLDSNLLLVFLSGSLGRGAFARFKRVSDYTYDDYELLVSLVGSFKVLMTTPHILTEVCNLADSLTGSYKRDWWENLAALVALENETSGLNERWIPASELSSLPEFQAYGITDAAVTSLSSEGLVITADYRLSGMLRSNGVPVINFRDLRKLRVLIQKPND